jgi:hypothetical protein
MVGLSFVAEGLFPRKGIDMWIRGTVRLIVVALLGIEITIIALASAASADTHPEGRTVANSTYENELHHGPAPSEAMEQFSDAMSPDMKQAWTRQYLLMARDHLQAMRDWPMDDQAWLREDMRAPQDRYEGLWAAESLERPSAPQQPPQPLTFQQPAARPEEIHRPKPRPRTLIGDGTLKRRAVVKAMRNLVRTGGARRPQAGPHAKVDLTRVVPRQAAVRMSHATASGWLKSAGLRTRSTGGCTSKHMHHCTSLDKVRTGTIARLIDLKQASRCPIIVTGGTEAGHAPGHYSHGNGYKIDIGHNSCIDRYITKHHDRSGIRSDGAPLYRSGSGTTFADESDHWDILFR